MSKEIIVGSCALLLATLASVSFVSYAWVETHQPTTSSLNAYDANIIQVPEQIIVVR